MKRLIAFVLVIFAAAALWYFTIPMIVKNFPTLIFEGVSVDHFSGVGSLFTILALTSLVFVVSFQALDAKDNKQMLESTIKTNKLHLEVLALTSLINECDTTLHRYDRWEKAGIKGDYTNSKADVRDKMNAYRKKLEQTYEEIQYS